MYLFCRVLERVFPVIMADLQKVVEESKSLSSDQYHKKCFVHDHLANPFLFQNLHGKSKGKDPKSDVKKGNQ